MKIKLDTSEKTIVVEETTNFGILMQKIEAILPNGEWKDYDLKIELIGNWTNVIHVDHSRWVNPQPYNPWQPWCGTTTGNLGYAVDTSTPYNIEI